MRFRHPHALTTLASVFALLGACTPVARAPSPIMGGAPLPTRPPVPGSPAVVTAFVNVGVVPMDRERVLLDQTVLVRNGWIVALGPAKELEVPAGAVQIDGKGQYLIPGLADMHSHLTTGMGPAVKSDSSVEQQLWSWWLAQGVTTIRNLNWDEREHGEQALRLKARAAAGEVWSPRIYTSALWADSLLVNWLQGSPKLKPDEIVQHVAAYKAAGYDFVKVHGKESPKTHDSLIAAARRVGIPVVGHAPFRLPPGEDPLKWALRGLQSIEHLTGYHQHLYLKHVQPELPKTSGDQENNKAFMTAVLQRLDSAGPTIKAAAEATQRAGVWNCPTLMIMAKLKPEHAAYRNRLTKALQDAGAGLLLGVDQGGAGQSNITVHDELEALVGAGLTPYQALVTGTRNPALYFGTLDSTGTVAIGKRADLVLLPGNPLVDIRNTTRPAGVMLGGRWLSRATIDQGLAAVKAAP